MTQPDIDIQEINTTSPGTPGDNGGFAVSETGTQGGDPSIYQNNPNVIEEPPSELHSEEPPSDDKDPTEGE